MLSKYAEQVKQARSATGLTQTMVDQLCGFTAGITQRIEAGRKQATFAERRRLNMALQINTRSPARVALNFVQRTLGRKV